MSSATCPFWKARNRINRSTRGAWDSFINGYVDPDGEWTRHIDELKKQNGLERVFRFDLGQNNDGCAGPVARRFAQRLQSCDLQQYLKSYPKLRCRPLRQRIGQLHDLSPDWVLLSAGIEQMIGLVANAFIDPGDPVLLPRPSFFVFENFSARMGARPIYLDLGEGDDYNWTAGTFRRFLDLLRRERPKIAWIASPNNPTGLVLPEELLPGLVDEAARNNCLVVIDEAYGEYVDPPGGVRSASSLLHSCKNLIVMRTFSKAFGLANIRLGYAMAGDPDILKALRLHAYNFPFGQLSLDIAGYALEHLDYLETTRQNIGSRRESFLAALDGLSGFAAVPSVCSILMLRHEKLSAAGLSTRLERNGVLTARIPGQGPVSERYVRVTLSTPGDNQVLLDNLAGLGHLDQERYAVPAGGACRKEPLREGGGESI